MKTNQDIVEQAVTAFTDKPYNCAQAILTAFAPQIGLDQATAERIGAGLGGGFGRSGETCGAANGMCIAISLAFSPSRTRDETYTLVREALRRFAAENGGIRCQDLLGYNISVPEEYAAAKEADLFAQRCPTFVRKAAEILSTYLEQEQHHVE